MTNTSNQRCKVNRTIRPVKLKQNQNRKTIKLKSKTTMNKDQKMGYKHKNFRTKAEIIRKQI